MAGPKVWSVYNLDEVQRSLMDLYLPGVAEKRAGVPQEKLSPPRVHPSQLAPLLGLLEKVTALAVKHAEKVRVWLSERGGFVDLWLQFTPIERELQAWQLRLINYRASVDACLATGDDASCTLWTVTAPLFFGFFGGASSKEPAQPADLMTPFKLANRLGDIVDADEASNIDALLGDLADQTKVVVHTLSDETIGALRALAEAVGKGAGATAGGLKAGLMSEAGGWILIGVGGLVAWWFLFRKPAKQLEAA